MNEQKLTVLCQVCLGECPKKITRCAVGQGNYVYIVEQMNGIYEKLWQEYR